MKERKDKMSAKELAALIQWQKSVGGMLPPGAAAKFVGMSRQGLHKAEARGAIRSRKVGSVRYYGIKDLEQL